MPLRGPTPSRQNPVPFLVFFGFFDIIVLAGGIWFVTVGDRAAGGAFMIALAVAGPVGLRVAWIIGTRRGL